jgi:cytochrome c biogenesis protein CcmG/thiol:disulfide interchange protein DsbE
MRKISVLLLVTTFVWLIFTSAIGAALRVEDPVAPAFKLKDIKGNNVFLSDYKGKVIFLNFWATWCPPCRAEIPDFIEAYDELNEKGLEIIGISLDVGGIQKVRSFVKNNKMNYPVVMGSQKVVDDYKPGEFIPTTIIIDRQGRIKHKHVGIMSKKMIERFFKEIDQDK